MLFWWFIFYNEFVYFSECIALKDPYCSWIDDKCAVHSMGEKLYFVHNNL